MRNLVKIFKALSDTNRLRILKMLEVRPLCVCEITDVLKLANSTVSKHLSILKDVEFINDIKEGKWVNYHLNNNSNSQYISQLLPLMANWIPDDKIVQADKLKVFHTNREFLCGLAPNKWSNNELKK